MSVSSVKNLNGESFSAVQDTALTDFVSSNSASWTGGGVVTATGGTNDYVQTINEKPISATIATYAPNGASLDSTFNYAASGYGASGYLKDNVIGNIANWNAATSAVTANSGNWGRPICKLWSMYDSNTALFGTGINIDGNVNVKFKPGNFMSSYNIANWRLAALNYNGGVYGVTASIMFNQVVGEQWSWHGDVFTVTNGHFVAGPQMHQCFAEWQGDPCVQLLIESDYNTAYNAINRSIRNSTTSDDNALLISFSTLIMYG